MTERGTEVVNKFKIVPDQLVVVQQVYYSYACPNCEENDIETAVVKAPHEKSIIPGTD